MVSDMFAGPCLNTVRLIQLPRQASRPGVRTQSECFHQWSFPDGRAWAEFYRSQHGFLVRFPKVADFEIVDEGSDVRCSPGRDTSDATVEHLYLNQVLPLALSLQDKLVFHASAVNICDVSVAFLGSSGLGKSTLATSFATSGHSFLTDDCLVLEDCGEGYMAMPSHPSIRLWEDSRNLLLDQFCAVAPKLEYTSKDRILAGTQLTHCDQPHQIVAAYVLADDASQPLSIDPLGQVDAMMAWAEHSFVLDIEDQERMQRNFESFVRLAAMIPCFRLNYPRAFDSLPATRNAIIDHVSSLLVAT